tara:strand:- start:1617 stop:3548 length:1932 start_codon:yes stop_codon:yes gene_type:complete
MAKSAKEIEVVVEDPEIEVIIEEAETDSEDEAVEEAETDSEDEAVEDTSTELLIPEGGIGGFAMSDEDFAILEAEEAKKEFGEEGLGQFTAVAKKMAGHGRFGDDSVAHIQTGEMVVPLTLLESNPALKAQIFKQLRDSGIEDPEQYVVGSTANSINPETGLMEFGFFSKLWKGIKKVVKSIVKIVKKIAPIVLPIALSMFGPLGAIYGAALGSGIGTLIAGGSIKDALKAGLVAGATGGLFKGASSKLAGDGFWSGVRGELTDPIGRVTQAASGAKTSVGNVFGSEATKAANVGKQGFWDSYVPPAAGTAPEIANTFTEGSAAKGAIAGDGTAVSPQVATVDGAMLDGKLVDSAGNLVDSAGNPIAEAGPRGLTDATGVNVDERGFLKKTSDFLTQGGKTDAEVLLARNNAGIAARDAAALANPTLDKTLLDAAFAKAAKGAGPGLLTRFGPSAAIAGIGASAAGFFDVPEQDMPGLVDRNEDGTVVTGADLIAADPSKYLVADLGGTRLNPDTGEYEEVEDEYTVEAPDTSLYTVPTNYPLQQQAISQNGYLMSSNPGGPFARPYAQRAAEGGPIFPRRNGGVAPAEGVEGQDSVRAMLMPGEFVMTTDAVRGLGNGNLNNGIKSMYSVMRNLESRGRNAA